MNTKTKYNTLILTRGRDLTPDSTELALAYEATNRNHKVSFQKPENFYVKNGKLFGITRRPNAETIDSYEAFGQYIQNETFMKRENLPLEEFDIIFSRVAYRNPDEKREFENMCIYLSSLESLNPKVTMVNSPLGMLMAGAKIYETLNLKTYMPETHITKDSKRLETLMKEAARDNQGIIGKPIDGMGGSGVIEIPPAGYRGLRTLAEVLVEPLESTSSIPAIIQSKLEGVDRRILIMGEEILGAYKRVPAEEEIRANIHLGGTVQAYELQDIDRMIVSYVAEKIKKVGLYFCGLDIMGPEEDGTLENTRMLELNVRCPGSIRSLESLAESYHEKTEIRNAAASKIIRYAENLHENKLSLLAQE